MPMTEKVDWRTDARWFKSFGRQDRSSFAWLKASPSMSANGRGERSSTRIAREGLLQGQSATRRSPPRSRSRPSAAHQRRSRWPRRPRAHPTIVWSGRPDAVLCSVTVRRPAPGDVSLVVCQRRRIGVVETSNDSVCWLRRPDQVPISRHVIVCRCRPLRHVAWPIGPAGTRQRCHDDGHTCGDRPRHCLHLSAVVAARRRSCAPRRCCPGRDSARPVDTGTEASCA